MLLLRNLTAVFTNGGPRALAWGIIVVVAGGLAQSASMAEMASMQPIAGAQYHWTHYLAPQKHRKFITWMQGTYMLLRHLPFYYYSMSRSVVH